MIEDDPFDGALSSGCVWAVLASAFIWAVLVALIWVLIT